MKGRPMTETFKDIIVDGCKMKCSHKKVEVKNVGVHLGRDELYVMKNLSVSAYMTVSTEDDDKEKQDSRQQEEVGHGL